MHMLVVFKTLRDQVIRPVMAYMYPLRLDSPTGWPKKKRDENLKGIQRIRLPAPNFACFPNLFQLKKIKIKVREIYWKKLPYAAETGSLGIMVSHSRAWW